MTLQADAFSIRKREEAVVVHDGVHVLNPHCIHISVKDDVPPLIFPVLRQRLIDLAEDLREKAVRPVA